MPQQIRILKYNNIFLSSLILACILFIWSKRSLLSFVNISFISPKMEVPFLLKNEKTDDNSVLDIDVTNYSNNLAATAPGIDDINLQQKNIIISTASGVGGLVVGGLGAYVLSEYLFHRGKVKNINQNPAENNSAAPLPEAEILPDPTAEVKEVTAPMDIETIRFDMTAMVTQFRDLYTKAYSDNKQKNEHIANLEEQHQRLIDMLEEADWNISQLQAKSDTLVKQNNHLQQQLDIAFPQHRNIPIEIRTISHYNTPEVSGLNSPSVIIAKDPYHNVSARHYNSEARIIMK